MFPFKSRKANVISHWYVLVPRFTTTSQEFYTAIESELKARKVPGLDTTRVEFSEGGLLSANRQYLRMTREMLIFDVCAAPFGTAYFFSCRFAELPAIVSLLEIAITLFGLGAVALLIFYLCGFWKGLVVLAVLLASLIVALGLKDLDATLMKLPVIGPVYIRFLRKETYYRHDTRLMYCDSVNEVVKAKVEEITGAKGIQLLRFNEFSPLLEELYKPRIVQPEFSFKS
jgi:hypothetical protein